MICDCEVYEICPSCAPSEETYMNAVAAHNEVVRSMPSPPPSYTLKEIEALAKEWATENEATNDARWIVSGLLAWLARREREGRG